MVPPHVVLVINLAADCSSRGDHGQGLDSGEQKIFRQKELDQMLAPLALYPDELLAQVLMAATYPLEVVQASRWIQGNATRQGDLLAAALEQQDWDPSVKSLVNFPSVLEMMNDRLAWTQSLGDAFLAQPDQVMDTVQILRQRVQAQGNLRTTDEQTILVEPPDQTIRIEPAVPQVVYIPVYDPSLVYVDAQKEYALRKSSQGEGLVEYARRLVSTPGNQDGLYWEAGAGEEPSPMGPLFAAAREEGYGATRLVSHPTAEGGRPIPYHGYFYRILKAQRAHAPGGARPVEVPISRRFRKCP
jgi:hypothetical protein